MRIKKHCRELNKVKNDYVFWLKQQNTDDVDVFEGFQHPDSGFDYYRNVTAFIGDVFISATFMMWDMTIKIDYKNDEYDHRGMSIDEFKELINIQHMEKKQSSVDWLVSITMLSAEEIAMAREMHRKEIMDAFERGFEDVDPELYYEETFNTQNMKARELRIGNWMHFDNMIGLAHDYQVTPRMFRQLGMDLSENLDIELNIFHKPIPLTEEWLVKLGFIEIHDNNWQDDETEIMVDLFNETVSIISAMPWKQLRHIKHVHTLQNLYFALTGEELELKQPI